MNETTNTSQTSLNLVAHTLVLGSVFLAPLLVIPFFANFMVTTKLLVLFVLALLLVGIFIWHTFQRRTLEIPRSPLVLAIILFGASSLLSSLFSSQYPVENLLGLGGAYVGAMVIAVTGGLLIRGRSNHDFQAVFNASIITLGVLTLAQTLGFGPSRFINAVAPYLNIPNTSIFNLAGAPFIAAQVFGLGLVANAFSWLKTRKLEMVSVATIVMSGLGLLLTIPAILPGQEATPLLLPAGVSWTIAIDVMKEPRAALVGVGPENYTAAYSIFKPTWVNGQTWWNANFGQGFDVPLTLLASTGLIGLATWLLLTFKTVRQAREQLGQLPFLSSLLLAIIFLQLVFPTNIVILLIQAIALAFFIANVEPRRNMTIHLLKVDREFLPFNVSGRRNNSLIGTLLPLAVAVLITGAGLYAVGRAYAASYTFFQSSVAMQEDDGVKVYDLQQRATILNPYISSYRSNYALTNLAIASALANKADATTQEQQQVGALIEQAIREARAATALRPADYQTWIVLAQIYRNLIGSAEGADQWSVSSYVQAINTNPTDPLIRIELGGLFFAAQQYNESISLFQQAVELKPDLPNGYYNLANALKAAGQLEPARQAYQQTLTLLPADSQDYIQANQELEELESQLATQSAQTTDESVDQTPSAQSTLPSIIDQNVNETNNSLINQPSSESLDVSEAPAPPAEEPVASPTP